MTIHYQSDRATIHHGDCLDVMKGMPDNSVDSVVTDPPYGLQLMSKKWDVLPPGVEVFVECLRLLKPGGHLLAFGGSRTYHRLACAVEDAGFEIRDQIQWVYGGLSWDTEILVDGKWEPYRNATAGRHALCYNTENGTYQWQPIQELYVYDYDDTAYRIVSDKTDQIVSRNHRCLVAREGWYGFQPAEELARDRKVGVPVLDVEEGVIERTPLLTDEASGTGWPHERIAAQRTRTDYARVERTHYQGKVWCVRVPLGAFVARRNGKVFVTGNSGFPKSADVSKMLDKAAGAEREVVSDSPYKASEEAEKRTEGKSQSGRTTHPPITAPATDAAKQWDGWGTALKPAHEPIVLARKPLDGTVAANVQNWGTGAINVDGCRVPAKGRQAIESTGDLACGATWSQDGGGGSKRVGTTDEGRFPANLIHDGSDEVLALFPVTKKAGNVKPSSMGHRNQPANYSFGRMVTNPSIPGDEGGSAARFFYTAKTSRRDREDGNTHPTVKPTDLMRYLCRLITPPGGVVLDPFAGSGSTGKAAMLEGFGFIGIEMEAEYVEIAKRRIEEARDAAGLFVDAEKSSS